MKRDAPDVWAAIDNPDAQNPPLQILDSWSARMV
jgi:hypothetical protein